MQAVLVGRVETRVVEWERAGGRARTEGRATRQWLPAVGKGKNADDVLFTVQLTVVKGSRFGPDELHPGTPISITHLDFGADVRRAALRSLPDLRLLHCHGGRAGRSAQHGAGRQLGARLSVRLRMFGEAKWRRFSKAGFGCRHHDGWRED